MATSGEHRLIALSEVDTAFDEKAVKELGRAAKLPTGADIARFGENIRIAARLYLEGKSRLNAPRLREKIERLYQLNMRAERGSDRAARALARGVEIMDDDVRRWLDSCNAGRCREIPTPAEILSPETRQSAIKRFRLILSFGGDVGPGRKRAGGRRSRSFTPHLRVPQGRRRGRPPGPEGDFVWLLAAAYLEATGKSPPYTANTGPFARFVFECFEKVGAPTGSVMRLINQFGSVRRQMERAHPTELSAISG